MFVLAALAAGATFASCQSTSPKGAVAKVVVGPDSTHTTVGQTVHLSATPQDAQGNVVSGTSVTWRSSDTSIATVDANGVVTAKATGSVTITASSGSVAGAAKVVVSHPAGAWATKVFIVMLENRDYADVIGSDSMPWLNSLANQYAYGKAYYAVTHPSIGNYFMLTTGDTITNDDNFTGPTSHDNIIRRLLAAGRTWKTYSEDIPSVGYLGNYSGNYIRHHNPPSYFTDVVNSAAQRQNIQTFDAFKSDLAAGTLPDYAIIVPNACNDGHSCGLNVADAWLRTNIAPLLASPEFQRDAILIVTFDESRTSTTLGGGKIPFVIAGHLIKRGFTTTTTYQHQSLLRMTMKALGLSSYPANAASARDMDEFFTP